MKSFRMFYFCLVLLCACAITACAENVLETEGTDGCRVLETPLSVPVEIQEGFPWLTDDMSDIRALPYAGRLGDEKSGDIWIHIIDAFERTAQSYVDAHISFMDCNGQKQLSEPARVSGLGGLDGYCFSFQGSDGGVYVEYAFVLEGNYLLTALARDEAGDASAHALKMMLEIQ